MGAVWVGIDTGGTFTDIVAIDVDRGRYHYHEVPTLTADPARGILDGFAEILDANQLRRRDVRLVCLGTSLAGCGPHHLYVLSGAAPCTGDYFVKYETLAGGMGARPSASRRALCAAGRLGGADRYRGSARA